MSPSSARETFTRVGPGIYQVKRRGRVVGFRAVVSVFDREQRKGRLVTKRFPKGTERVAMSTWRQEQRVLARQAPITAPSEPVDTKGFAGDAARYLKAVAAMPSFSDRERDIARWVQLFGERQRATITSTDIASALAAWAKTKGAATVNHRRTALMHLWTVLDGRSAANPVKAAPKYREPDPAPRGIPYALIRRILDKMPTTKAKARLSVIAWTGLPHAQVARITPGDVDLERRVLRVPGRNKGRGTEARALPLTVEAVSALKVFAAVGAWGEFSRSSVRKSFALACTKVAAEEAKKPARTRVSVAGLRPYDLRHSFGTELYRATGDIRATQLLMGHSRVEMTHRYTLGAVDERLADAVRAFGTATAVSPARAKTPHRPTQTRARAS